MGVQETWKRFLAESASCNERLNLKLRQSWQSLQDLLLRQAAAFDAASRIDQGVAARLGDLSGLLHGSAQSLLVAPLDEYRRQAAQQRVAEAFDEWDRTLERLIGAMPEVVAPTPAEWAALAGPDGKRFSSRVRFFWRRKPKQVMFRNNLLAGLHAVKAARIKLEGQLMKALAESSLEMIFPWQSIAQSRLPLFFRYVGILRNVDRDGGHFRRRLRGYDRRMASLLKDLLQWTAGAPFQIVRMAPFARDAARSGDETERRVKDFEQCRDFWSRQIHAVESEIGLQRTLLSAERLIAAEAKGLLANIHDEHSALLSELNRVAKWFEEWQPSEDPSFPPPTATVTTAADRFDAWRRTVMGAMDVPESVETAARIATRPGRRRSFRTQAPHAVLRESLRGQAEGTIRKGLEQLERQHIGMLREIDRAREVVAFASEMARKGGPEDRQIEREGIENARSLLQFAGGQTKDLPAEVEWRLASGLAAGFLRTHTVLEAGQGGVVRYAARHGFPATARSLSRRGAAALREGAVAGVRVGAERYREALIRIRWIPAPTAEIPRVIARDYVSRSLAGCRSAPNLPMLYQRLFRLSPIEDPRFLIGRQDEMNALAEARRLWEDEREAAVLIVGERGSGKTSLLNCALQGPLSRLDIIRADLSTRWTSAADMLEFVGRLIGVPPRDVEAALRSARRVIVLEELERAYLRRINHFDGLRALINLISKTSKHTLWLISTNYFAFRLLNAALKLDPCFSHRINAMAVDRAHLREAILLRHNLSGLRLQFAPGPSPQTRMDHFRKAAGVTPNPEDAFFDRIYQDSGGVFRTAFALWQRYIDRADGGVLYMRPLTAPNFKRVIDSLGDLDLFTLAAILQHGSLTPAEHNTVFETGQASSTALLDNLLAKELIELDPGRGGFRVVPEAGELVRQTLFNRNVA